MPEQSGALPDGTGDNALHIAALGLPVLGVDVAETALAIARLKAADRGIKAEFTAADVLRLKLRGGAFTTVLDSGLFHTFDAGERLRYVASLAAVTEHGGTLYVLCFSDDGPATGPHPVSQEELRVAFSPAADGMSSPSDRTGFRQRSMTRAVHQPGSRQSGESR